MSTEIGKILNTGKNKNEINLTSFDGGDKNGIMLQITQGFGGLPDEPGFIQLTPKDAYLLISEIAQWLKMVAGEKAERLKILMEENKELQKTVLKDAVECEHFISDLKILEIPLKLLDM